MASPRLMAVDRFYFSGYRRDPQTGAFPRSGAQVQLSLDRIKSPCRPVSIFVTCIRDPTLLKRCRKGDDEVICPKLERGNTPARATIVVAWLPE